MIFKAKIVPIICITAMFLAAPRHTEADAADVQQLHSSSELFSVRLLAEIAKENVKRNIALSPLSIEIGLAMARLGAEGETAREIDQILDSTQKTKHNYYRNILAGFENSSVIKMANIIYTMSGYTIKDEFKKLLSTQFFSKPESLNFAQSETAANTINNWVEEKTNHFIKNLVDPQLFDNTTRLVLVNAIHFMGNWVEQFSKKDTREMDFYLDETRTTKVQMMRAERNFIYANLPELDAQALKLPYKDSDLFFLVILPKKRSGLAELENKLKNISLSTIVQKMYTTGVFVIMPKFKVEFQQEMSQTLSKMGMKRMFSKNAEFGKILESDEDLYVSSVVHKVFIEVNERGTEADAATAMDLALPISMRPIFFADHGFFYSIRSESGVTLFEGRQVFGQ